MTADLHGALIAQPRSSLLHSALGAMVARAAPRQNAAALQHAIECFRTAVALQPQNVLARLNLVEALIAAHQREPAGAEAIQALKHLDSMNPSKWQEWLGGVYYPRGFTPFRVEWERVAWCNVGQPAAEARAKHTLLRWRLHARLGALTGKLSHHYEAVLARPDLPVTQAALGCALVGAQRPGDAVAHLRACLDVNPFDKSAARALHQALGATANPAEQRRLAHARRLLHEAAPQPVPAEPWFENAPPAADELASVIIVCCNQLDFTRQCLDSLLRHTRGPYEIILVDNGSTDGTPAFLEEFAARHAKGSDPLHSKGSVHANGSDPLNSKGSDPFGPERVLVLRNDTNRGYAPAANQGLARARGEFLVLLNNDTLLTAQWLEGLIGLALHDYPKVGFVGPVSNGQYGPAQVPADYSTIAGLEAFAERRRKEFTGQAIDLERLVGFCLLVRRDVFRQVGFLDEQFGPGFFEDDDYGLRARKAGYRLALALGVFVHHHGNATLLALGIDRYKLLLENFERFKAKWGEEQCAGYRLPEPPPHPCPSPPEYSGRGDEGAPTPDVVVKESAPGAPAEEQERHGRPFRCA